MSISRIAVFFLPIFFPLFALASDFININTADAALLDTLPGIGPAYAARIVEYRAAHGPFARTEDIQNVSGIGPSTYAEIAPFITVASASVSQDAASSTPSEAASGAASEAAYEPPAALTVKISGAREATMGAPLFLSARAATKNGVADYAAQITWSFGDGSAAVGREVEKTYRYAGTYLVVAEAVDGLAKARDELAVVVKPAAARIVAATSEGIMVANDSSERLDLSGWQLRADLNAFRLPNGTVILPRASILFPSAVTHLVAVSSVMLLYPDGAIAERWPGTAPGAAVAPAPAMQLTASSSGYESVQAVEPITSVTSEVHDQAVAPAVPTYAVGTAGAAYAPAPVLKADVAMIPSFLRSPWFLGFLGVVALAGGAFIFL
ncbi:helix-hairpin-helix domain-containing protein [Candidatus Kaiserbacteria bacterium]|nr:helix-hairpin-helix domain-containing protein [Candidatus Kaiserbacteria bacterium]